MVIEWPLLPQYKGSKITNRKHIQVYHICIYHCVQWRNDHVLESARSILMFIVHDAWGEFLATSMSTCVDGLPIPLRKTAPSEQSLNLTYHSFTNAGKVCVHTAWCIYN